MTMVTFDDSKLKLIKDTICKGASDDELQMFLHVCQKSGLDPILRQIYSIKRGTTRTIQTSIDGLRLIADRTQRYAPGKETVYAYDAKGALVSATAYVRKMTPDGTWHDVSSTAFLKEYDQKMGLWGKLPHVMLAKCAEAAALRRAFPAEMCGLYTGDEMEQAEVEEVEVAPKEILKLTDIQVGEITDMLNDEEYQWLLNLLKSKGYESLHQVERSKFQGLVKTIKDRKGVK